MKRIALISVPLMLLALGGAWFWLGQDQNVEPVVFHNQPLNLPPASETKTESQANEGGATTLEVPPPVNTPLTLPDTPPDATVTPSPSPVSVVERPLNFGFRVPSTPRTIDTIVLHSSYNASGGDSFDLDKIIGQYEQYGVGAHYLIDRSGKVYRLVIESTIAYHAGESKMPDGRKNVNDFSIGIELMGTEESGFTEKQYAAVNDLITDIKTRHKIKDIVGHGDIAPTRKSDPWKFDWTRLK